MERKVKSSNKICFIPASLLFPFPAPSFQTPLLLLLMMCCPALWTYKFKRRILHLVITDSVPRATEGGGSHNSGESPALTRQNDRAEERPDSRADLLVHPLQARTDTHTHRRTNRHRNTRVCTQTRLLGRCMKIIERINLTWAEISFRLFGLFHTAQHGGKIMRSSLG